MQASLGIDGKRAQERLEACGITANANATPNDPLPPFRPSGLRLGTPAITTRGMTEDNMPPLAELIIAALSTDDPDRQAQLAEQVVNLIRQFPLPY